MARAKDRAPVLEAFFQLCVEERLLFAFTLGIDCRSHSIKNHYTGFYIHVVFPTSS